MRERGNPSRHVLTFFLIVPVVALLLSAAGAPALAASKQERAENARVEAVIAAALAYLGQPYRLGAEGPNEFDCSGFVYRAFDDAGQLEAIGGTRMRAAGYLRWFDRRGLATRDETVAERGDLVVYADGEHIGIYLGRGEVVSALTGSGITVHRTHGLNYEYSHVLKLDWSKGGPPPPIGEADGEGDRQDAGDGRDGASGADGEGVLGVTTGSLNLRTQPDPAAAAVGVISRGSSFKVIGAGRSPSGALWLNVETGAGQTGWIWSQFTDVPEGTDLEAIAAGEPESEGVATGSLNLRAGPDPAAEIVGWVSQGETFAILGGANSSTGWLWLNVETASGQTGWVWSYWTEYAEDLIETAESVPAAEAPADVPAEAAEQAETEAAGQGENEAAEQESQAPESPETTAAAQSETQAAEGAEAQAADSEAPEVADRAAPDRVDALADDTPRPNRPIAD